MPTQDKWGKLLRMAVDVQNILKVFQLFFLLKGFDLRTNRKRSGPLNGTLFMPQKSSTAFRKGTFP